jgi:hypothetical protein
MSERTVEQMCRDLLDGELREFDPNAVWSKQIDGIVERLVNTLDLAQLRKDAERPITFLLSHPDGRLFMAFGKTATEAVLSIDADKSRIDEWTICDEKDYGKPIDMRIMTAFFGPRQ